MNNNTRISIDGSYLKTFEQVNLKQSINDHHEFKVVVDHDEVELLGSHTLDASKVWLGKSIIISFDKTEFSGIITSINLLHNNGHNGLLEVLGYSKTILLEQGKHTTSWLNKNLSTILKDTLGVVDIETKIKPEYTEVLAYEAQYGESHFEFIQRLCKQYNEWLFWDGIKLIIGKPILSEPMSLQYGQELSNINIGIKAQANSYNIVSYNSANDARHESSTSNSVLGLNELGRESFNASLGIFKTKVNTHSVARVKNKSELDASLKKKQSAVVANLHMLEADCTQQNLSVGSVIKVSSAKNEGKANFDIQNYGEYLITEIEHTATGKTYYKSHFKAIPSGVEVLPEPDVSIPQAHSQIATIIDNADPKGLGRVKVQLLWQKHDQTTTWIRVMTPDAGSSDHHSQNRGHVFIPEVGDQVMVSFRYNDPNRPFVLGSLFNGTTGAGGKDQNNYKSIITKSGHTLEFNDTPNSESITITDKNSNMIFIDTANKNIKISAPETIDIEAKNINFRATETITHQAKNMDTQIGEDLVVGVGNNMNTVVEQSYDLQTTELTETIEGNKTVDIQSSLSINASEADIIADNGDINVQGAGIATFQGGSDVKVSKG